MTGFRMDRSWPALTPDEKHAAVQVLASRRLTRSRIAERLGCDVKTVDRYSGPAVVPPAVLADAYARFRPAGHRRAMRRGTDTYPARA